MSQWISEHQPCPCGSSSDAYSVHEDGHGFCFSCNKVFQKESNVEEFTYEYLPRRGITKGTHEFFDVKTQVDSTGKPVSVAYPHPNGYAQIKFLEKKGFRFKGTVTAGGFCRNLFPAGSAKAITITEGFDDGMSAWQMLGKYPVYSVRSASTALSDVRADYEYLNSFEKIYLCLDDDEPGRNAVKQIAPVFGYGKVYIVKNAPLKDATDYLEQNREKEFKAIWYNAQRYMPDTVVSSFADIEKSLEEEENLIRYSWPFPSFQAMTGGIEVHRQYVLSGLEGTGKTEVLHQTLNHLLHTYPNLNLGILHMEEPLRDTIKMQVGKEIKRPIHLPEFAIPTKELMTAYKNLVGREDRVHFFRHFGSEETDVLLNTIRFIVAACGAQVVVFDNYQHAVTGRTRDRDVEALDFLANRLESLVKELPFALISISHENDDEKTRGSRNISKETDVWINIKRDIKHENAFIRDTQYVTFNKNRQAGKTGPAGRLHYDQATATLSEISEGVPA